MNLTQLADKTKQEQLNAADAIMNFLEGTGSREDAITADRELYFKHIEFAGIEEADRLSTSREVFMTLFGKTEAVEVIKEARKGGTVQ